MRNLRNYLLWMFTVIFFSSCGMMRRAQEKRVEELGRGLDKNQGTFVLKNDSTVVPYDGLKIKSPLFGKSKFILDGGTEILAKEVRSYQTDIAYYTWTGECGWTPRINLAPISKYQGTKQVQEFQAGSNGRADRWRTRTVIVNYIQKENGPLKTYTPKALYNMVTDYSPSVELLDEFFKKKKTLSAIGWLNTGAFVAGAILTGTFKNDANGEPIIGAKNYIGMGLMGGSIVYGFVNRKKKRTNYANVELAYDEYNSGYGKKRRR